MTETSRRDDGGRWSAASRFRLKELDSSRTKLALLELGIDGNQQQQQQQQQQQRVDEDGNHHAVTSATSSMDLVRKLLRAQTASTGGGGGGAGRSMGTKTGRRPSHGGADAHVRQKADGHHQTTAVASTAAGLDVKQRPLTVGDIRRRRDENWQQPTAVTSGALRVGRGASSNSQRCRQGTGVAAAAKEDPIAALDASIGHRPSTSLRSGGSWGTTPSSAGAQGAHGVNGTTAPNDAYRSLAVDDLHDDGDVFDLNDGNLRGGGVGRQDAHALPRRSSSSTGASSTSSSSSEADDDDCSTNRSSEAEADCDACCHRGARLAAASATSSIAMSSREALTRMQLEIERYELSQSLAALMTRRKALQAKKEEEQERRARVASEQEGKLRAFKDNAVLLSTEMNAEWAAYRSKLDAERRALRLRQCPGGDDGIRKKFFKTKYASPWQSIPVQEPAAGISTTVPPGSEGTHRHSSPAAPQPQLQLEEEARAEDVGVGATPLAAVRRLREEDRRKLASLPQNMRDEILVMRTCEVARCAGALEPTSREAIADTEHRVRAASIALLLDGLIAESCQRNSIRSAGAAEWASLVRHENGLRHKLQISAWMPTIFQDKSHLMARSAAEIVPQDVQASVLQSATEAHRKAVRATWDAVFRLREELVQHQRRKMKLKDELKFARTELQCFATVSATASAAASAPVCPREVAVAQRVQILELQVSTLEEREQSIKNEIEWKQSRVW